MINHLYQKQEKLIICIDWMRNNSRNIEKNCDNKDSIIKSILDVWLDMIKHSEKIDPKRCISTGREYVWAWLCAFSSENQ